MALNVNYSSAAIFWGYIAAALVLSWTILRTLVSLPRPPSTENDASWKRSRVVFSILAATSFACLSFNMLNILYQSYSRWSAAHPEALVHDLQQDVWLWSLTSTLFQDFAEAIISNQLRFFWAQSELLAAFAVCFNMGIEGVSRGIPNLTAFFCIAQILPVSFAQNLFYIAQLYYPEPMGGALISTGASAGLVAAYAVCLIKAPEATAPSTLIKLILAARALLFAPIVWIDFEKEPSQKTHRTAQLVGWMVLFAATALTLRELSGIAQIYSFSELTSALFDHPAVTSLGVDSIISVVSFLVASVVFRNGRGPSKSAAKSADTRASARIPRSRKAR